MSASVTGTAGVTVTLRQAQAVAAGGAELGARLDDTSGILTHV